MTKSKGILQFKERGIVTDRFWSKVDVRSKNECWNWLGRKVDGYGRFAFRGESEKANRVAWILVFGELNKEYHVLHKCDNPSCVNPNHLFLGTNLDNIVDKVQKNRQSKGVERPAHKLDDNKVIRLRDAYASGRYSQSVLAKMFGVSISQISLAVNYKSWKHIR